MAWTPKQLQAITQKGSNILVAAAAGSGKTAVLVERIINKIVKEHIDIDKLLIVTFTNAAATEMRERVLESIYKKLEIEPDNLELRRQIILINKSNISTIHAFCLEVIKNNFYQIDISPNFRLASTPEIELLRMETIEKTFDELYEKQDKEFIKLIDTYCSYRDDDNLKEIILKIYKYIQSMPFPEEWLNSQVEKFNRKEDSNFSDTEWGKILMQSAKENINEGIKNLKQVVIKLTKEMDLTKWRMIIEEDIESLSRLLNINEWDEFYHTITSIKFRTWVQDRKIISDIKEEAKEVRDKVKDQIKKLKEKIFLYPSKQANKDIGEMYEILKGIEKLLNKFSKDYEQIKKEKNVIDFNDIEHLALKILIEKDETGNYVPTEIAEKYQEKFEEIAIDEYQDSNEIQEYMLNIISRGNNIFMVGDVKQSIYKFRQSRPELFIEKYNTYEENKIQLYANFRSRGNVLNITNTIFENMMSKEFGNIEYDQSEFLNLGLEYPIAENKKTLDEIPELNIIDLKEDKQDIEEDEETEEIKLEKTEIEAKFVANKIQELMKANYYVADKKLGYRKLQLKDIVILLRKTSNVASIYEKEILNLGYPVFSDVGTNYFESMEIQIIMNLLKVINNPENDIALVTVLRSPIWNFTDNELLEIKMQKRNASFYESLVANKEIEEEKLRKKVINFLNELEDFMEKEEYLKLDELIWYIYEKTDFYHYVSLMKNGDMRVANLKMLFEKAKDYEQGSFKGLYNFIKFIDKVTKAGSDMGAPKLIGENEDVIRIMSIHKSKGLEFPVVFLCGTGNQFNMMDLNDNILLHSKIGIGPKYINYERKIQYNTLAKEAIKIQSKQESLEEEMRLLYVALTRSREKLIITGVEKNLDKSIQAKKDLLKLNVNPDKIDISTLKKAKSYLEWIELVSNYDEKMQELMTTKIYTLKDVTKKEQKQKGNKEIIIKEMETRDEIKKILTWKYLRTELTKIEGKSSVSAMVKQGIEENYKCELTKPKFMEKELKLSKAEIGTAVHLVMQKLDFKKEYHQEEIEEMLGKLVERNILTTSQKAEIPIEKILIFTKSDLFQELKKAKQVFKEQPFYINLPIKEIYGKDIEEEILVQGVIDLYFINEKDEIILVDYKTDYVPNGEENYLVEKYKGQLDLYKRAIEQALNKKVKHTYLYSTYLGKKIEIL